jgi:hypothetical protein
MTKREKAGTPIKRIPALKVPFSLPRGGRVGGGYRVLINLIVSV